MDLEPPGSFERDLPSISHPSINELATVDSIATDTASSTIHSNVPPPEVSRCMFAHQAYEPHQSK